MYSSHPRSDTYAYAHTCTHQFIHTCMHTQTHAHNKIKRACIHCMRVCIHTQTYRYASMQICMHASTNAYTYMHTQHHNTLHDDIYTFHKQTYIDTRKHCIISTCITYIIARKLANIHYTNACMHCMPISQRIHTCMHTCATNVNTLLHTCNTCTPAFPYAYVHTCMHAHMHASRHITSHTCMHAQHT